MCRVGTPRNRRPHDGDVWRGHTHALHCAQTFAWHDYEERFSDDQHGGVWQEVVGEQGANVPHSDISPWACYRTPSSPLLAFLISKSAAGMRVRWLLHYLSSRHERMEIGKWEKYSPGVSSMLLLEVFTNSSFRGRRTIISTAERQAWKAVSQTVLVSTLTWKTEFYHTSD